VRPTTIIWAD